MADVRIPIASPVRNMVRALAEAAHRGVSYDAGRVLFSAATDPELDRDTLEGYLLRAEDELDYRIRQCDPEIPDTRDRAVRLRDYVRHAVGLGAYRIDEIVEGVATL